MIYTGRKILGGKQFTPTIIMPVLCAACNVKEWLYFLSRIQKSMSATSGAKCFGENFQVFAPPPPGKILDMSLFVAQAILLNDINIQFLLLEDRGVYSDNEHFSL